MCHRMWPNRLRKITELFDLVHFDRDIKWDMFSIQTSTQNSQHTKKINFVL